MGPDNQIYVLPEPNLSFGFGQSSPSPKEGLFLFGPSREGAIPKETRCGVVGTPSGIGAYREWVSSISRPVEATENAGSIFFPGYRELLGSVWSNHPVAERVLSPFDISSAIHLSDRHEAVHRTVSLFSDAITSFIRDEEPQVDVWFVVIPDEVFELGRPRSKVVGTESIQSTRFMNPRLARKLRREPSLFDEDMSAAIPYLYQVDFHNQLKARLIKSRAITQVVRESTFAALTGKSSKRRIQDAATVAWNLSVATFYKAGGRPWSLSGVRPGVCYVGLVFKQDNSSSDSAYACCGAQMFLSSGEGMVFKGAPGPWYSLSKREFHLGRPDAAELGRKIVAAYRDKVGEAPRELFIHGRTYLSPEEIQGFCEAIPPETKFCGVRITRSDEFKLYRDGKMPVLRGTLLIENRKLAYLWTSGYVSALDTYPGWEVPNPLRIEVTAGQGEIEDVAADIFCLTKLNYNACLYGDGLPVTLRFADAIGEILTAAPAADIPDAPLPFRHYI